MKFIAELTMWIACITCGWNIFKLLFVLSANAGTKLSKKIGTDNEYTDGAIEYQNRNKKKFMNRALVFGAIALIAYFIMLFSN